MRYLRGGGPTAPNIAANAYYFHFFLVIWSPLVYLNYSPLKVPAYFETVRLKS